MDKKPNGLPDPGTGKRRKIDAAALTAALTEQQRRDKETPPASLLTTMGALRLLGNLVFDRRERGWTDPELVVQLRELGVEISPETLRVYRSRLKKERGGDIATVPAATPTPATEPATLEPPAATPSEAAGAEPARPPTPAPVPAAQATRSETKTEDDNQLPFDRSIPFDDRV